MVMVETSSKKQKRGDDAEKIGEKIGCASNGYLIEQRILGGGGIYKPK
jgi:hypothetical protein